jgi:hypothetical protein
MSKVLRNAVLMGAFSLVAVSSAGATTGPGMVATNGAVGVLSNTGAVSGNSSTYSAHVFTAGGSVVSCADSNFTVVSTTTTTVTLSPSYTGCRFTVAGTVLGSAAIESSCNWTLDFSRMTFNTATGAGSSGTITTGCVTSVTVPASSCTINVAAQTQSGISLQNVDATGANSTAATPWGVKVVAAISGLTYDAVGSCLIAAHGTGSYSGTVAGPNIFGSL